MSDVREKYMTKAQLDRMGELSEEHHDFMKKETGSYKIAIEQSEGFDRGYEAACLDSSKTPMTHFWIDESFKRQCEIINLRSKLDTAVAALEQIIKLDELTEDSVAEKALEDINEEKVLDE